MIVLLKRNIKHDAGIPYAYFVSMLLIFNTRISFVAWVLDILELIIYFVSLMIKHSYN